MSWHGRLVIGNSRNAVRMGRIRNAGAVVSLRDQRHRYHSSFASSHLLLASQRTDSCGARTHSHSSLQSLPQTTRRRFASDTTTPVAPSLSAKDFRYCVDLVQNRDRESYLCGLLMPSDARKAYFAIRAWNVELASIKDGSTQKQPPTGGDGSGPNVALQVRIQWWWDALGRIYEDPRQQQQQQQRQQQQQQQQESKDELEDHYHEHDHDHEDHISANSSIMDGDDSEAFQLAPPSKLGEDHDLHNVNDNDTLPKSQKHERRLSEALKTGTEEAHKEAESVHFVRNFIRGIIDRRSYALFVAQMFHVYRHLERALEEHAPHHFADCHFPVELNRSEALREDVDFWHSTSGGGANNSNSDADADADEDVDEDEEDPPISPATQDYLDRIDEVARTRPILLLAHAYTRYLGDLSGGKVLARVAKRALRLEKGADGTVEGLAFYDFPLLKGSVKAFKDKYRQALNDLHIEENNDDNNDNDNDDVDETVQAIVKEANVAFLLNMRLFEELDVTSSVPGASVRPIADVYARVAEIPAVDETTKNEDVSKAAAPCPFLSRNTAVAGRGNIHHAAGVGDGALAGAGAVTTKSSGHGHGNGKTCPWPFILLHDPKTGMKHWQTWLTIGLVVAYVYQKFLGA